MKKQRVISITPQENARQQETAAWVMFGIICAVMIIGVWFAGAAIMRYNLSMKCIELGGDLNTAYRIRCDMPDLENEK